MELERQALKTRSSSGNISTVGSKGRKKPGRVAGLELSPELVAIALGKLASSQLWGTMPPFSVYKFARTTEHTIL